MVVAGGDYGDGRQRVALFFGTQAGTAKGFARALAEEAKARYDKAVFKVVDMDDYAAEEEEYQDKLKKDNIALFFLASDGALSNVEFSDFQVRCLSAPLQPSEISGVKRVVQEKMPEGVNDSDLTLTGFLFLHALFIEKGPLETTWTILSKFGYDMKSSLEITSFRPQLSVLLIRWSAIEVEE